MTTTLPVSNDEQAILNILRTLSTERVDQVIDFARFLQLQEFGEQELLHPDETEAEVRADNDRWDKTFATSQSKLSKLAEEARAEIQAGHTMKMVFTADGRIVPE